ncbi:hypothetical protein [Niallia circulans]|uniref:hypothetical protein n=1 Tax=Niallia circulans TaxID=1397 RepID=UPI0019D1619F|nr:hypothetical protein [Niallia circulans]
MGQWLMIEKPLKQDICCSLCLRVETMAFCSLLQLFFLFAGTENGSLFPFSAFLLVCGHREWLSVPFFSFSSCLRAQSTALCSLFQLFFLFVGTENGSLFPSSAFLLVCGHRERLSVPFFSFSSCLRAQRTALCSLFQLFFLFAGTENGSLFPSSAFLLVCGHRERLSVPFFSFSSCLWAQTMALCSLLQLFFLFAGTENGSLFSSSAFLLVCGHRERLSVPFFSFSSCLWAQTMALCSLFQLFFLFVGTDNGSLFPFSGIPASLCH